MLSHIARTLMFGSSRCNSARCLSTHWQHAHCLCSHLTCPTSCSICIILSCFVTLHVLRLCVLKYCRSILLTDISQYRFSHLTSSLSWTVNVCILQELSILRTISKTIKKIMYSFWKDTIPIVVHSMCYVRIVKVLRKRKIKVGPIDVSRNKENTCTNTGQNIKMSKMPSTSTPSFEYQERL